MCGTYGGRRRMYIVFWWGNLKERDCVEELGIDSILKRILKTQDETWNGSIWLTVGTNDRHF